MRYKSSVAAALALSTIGAGAAPALARTERHHPRPIQSERQEDAAIQRALRSSSSALRVAHAAQGRVAVVARREAAAAKSLGALGAIVATVDKSVGALTNSLQALAGGVSKLNSEVNDPNSGLGKVDNGVAELIVTPSGGSPTRVAPVFAPGIPQAPFAGATGSGTITYPCQASSCTFAIYAADDSNRPQPSSGPAAYVGGTVTVTSDGNGQPGSAVTFQTAGETPANQSNGGTLVPITSRSPLGSLYPAPGQAGSVLVPIATATNGNSGTITLPGGVYTISATVNFIGELAGS